MVTLSQYVDEALAIQEKLQSLLQGIGESAYGSAKDSINSTTTSIAISLLISLLFAGVVGWRLSNSIKAPMTIIQNILRQMARGDFRQRVKGKFSGEFAELQSDINVVIHEFNNAQVLSRRGQSRLA